MWSDRKPWWVKKAKDLQAENSHYKNWCVIKVLVSKVNNIHGWSVMYVEEYRAIGRANAPTEFTPQGKIVKRIEVDNLTKHEAHCVAKGLNFLDGETKGI